MYLPTSPRFVGPLRVRGGAPALGLLLLGSVLFGGSRAWSGETTDTSQEPIPVAAGRPSPTPVTTMTATTPIYLLAGNPACPDPAQPCGVPLSRVDWVITKDYAAHGGPGPWGAVDFAFWWNRAAYGTPVLATHTGRALGIRNDSTYGQRVYVQNTQWTTIYSHLEAILIADNQWVVRGQVIGLLGSSGKSTGPHIDYQVWEENQRNRDPHAFCQCGTAGAEPDPNQPGTVATRGSP